MAQKKLIQHNYDKVVIYNAILVESSEIDKKFDLELEEKRIGRKYRKKISKKIAHLTFLEKKNILRLADQEFINGLIALDHPRKNHYMSHYDRFYLSTRLHYIDDAMDQLKKVEKLQKVQKQKANIKLVWTNHR